MLKFLNNNFEKGTGNDDRVWINSVIALVRQLLARARVQRLCNVCLWTLADSHLDALSAALVSDVGESGLLLTGDQGYQPGTADALATSALL